MLKISFDKRNRKVNLHRLLIACIFFFSTLVFSGDFEQANALYAKGELDLALEKVNALLAQQPKEAQARFLKALILTDQKKISDAIPILIGLTEDYPTLPEPYNNLAVLYALQQRYEEASAMLELVIHLHPDYTTAYENLGDIYAHLARRSYDNALKFDQSNTAISMKAAVIKRLFAFEQDAPSSLKKETPQTHIDKALRAVSGAEDKSAINDAAQEQIRTMVNAWAKSWSGKRIEDFLAFYAPDFAAPLSDRREGWARMRRLRANNPREGVITVRIVSIKINPAGREAFVVFRQSWLVNEQKSENIKTFKLVKYGEKWLIRAEKTGL